MKKTIVSRVTLVLAVLLLCVSYVPAQTSTPPRPRPTPRIDNPTADGQSNDRPLTTFEEEMRAKRAIRMAEKDHQENLDRARELNEIAKELQGYLKEKTTLDRTALKKVERLEKLTKKIRGEAGGEDEEVQIVDRPANITAAINQIAESAESLSKSVQNTPRQVVSASMIGNANVLLELIRILRAFNIRP